MPQYKPNIYWQTHSLEGFSNNRINYQMEISGDRSKGNINRV